MIPVVDLLAEPVLNGGAGLVDPFRTPGANLLQMLRDDLRNGVGKSLLLQIAGDLCALRAGQQRIHVRLIGAKRPVIEVRRVMKMVRYALCVQFDIEHLLRDGTPVAILEATRVLDGVLHIEEDSWTGPGIPLVYEYGSPAKQIAMPVEREIERSIKKRMAWADKSCEGLSLRRYEVFLEGDALIAGLDSFAGSNQAVAVADSGRNASDLVSAGLALTRDAAQVLEGFQKE